MREVIVSFALLIFFPFLYKRVTLYSATKGWRQEDGLDTFTSAGAFAWCPEQALTQCHPEYAMVKGLRQA